ncbi:helix-turn-helix domain-containing protein [Jiangella alkaliphila]|uniref:DNA binding domain-containing protein, excisionase family n=1 Tax=Jiangella alkaliphila TaxID=419479 RepID=A0A1H2K070_9ACTN|nr:helix-turn-helix domain-containing protein [Jiangella alkaliphila]SDU61735.1 DNA binding domain-containing protein, excisionase family [Jiangella alkaliphila]
MAHRFATSVAPGEVEQDVADRALGRIASYLGRHDEAQIELHTEAGRSDEVLVVPRAAVQLFASMLAYMAEGKGVSVMPMHTMLTTQQAADLLNVSRPYFIGLLERGDIAFEKVGRHRRVRLEDLLNYQRASIARQRAAADDLAALGQELGT